ncbi:D-glycerate dehydrogenase [Domibacillus sp. DTU_2020_1001157_1_SI_ALB_TIR_016]|uniref:2-hydroxyacid dehydrogenase n=1 Tax=Domibacillus sp. DTU_2020_1001157_1_SI_ALB_TIR_016 TaxID=3077789 RepID=UPI0028E7BEF9|nr:D-glycerate dehydrogenase [Domibacillus sp. DTU_2020_1001157_1_SI_ALB_TIR_016]WNS79580.1 D-glycerate dehydrogenase [Domibacillus sp. DTU_2020_1001157_1_SI_ALB_TIR_016]
MKPKVYITRKLPKPLVEKVSYLCDVRMWQEAEIPVPPEVLEKEIRCVDGLLCLLTETIDDSLMSKAKNLKIIANMAVGYNNIDLNSATKRGIMVTNTPGVLTETTADLTFALLMATARRIVESSDYLRKGEWTTWSPMQLTGQDIYGATLGIVGLGRIGEALVKRAKGFDMNVLYYNRSRKVHQEETLKIKFASLENLLTFSDFVCVMTPYTRETHHLIGKEQLALMKENAVLINTARGGIVDEDALYHALKTKQIWGAGIDVFENEPVSLDHPLLTLPSVVTLPHIGSASIVTRTKMADLAITNLLQGVRNSIPDNLLNEIKRNEVLRNT